MLKKILATALVCALLSGCGNGQKTSKTSNDATELTMFMHFYGYCVYKEDWPIFKKASELTGVKIKGTASESISDSTQAWSAMISSNVLPDIIHSSRANMRSLASDGGLLPLDDLIEKYAPNIKKFFEDCPEARLMATDNDGHIYWIPGSLSGIDQEALPSKGWFIRTDWLDKLGLKAPTTVDELYNVLKAFKTMDPNGNGKADEIPYFNRQEGILDLYQLFDAYYNWHEDKNGALVYGKSEESFRNAVREIAKWYKEGLIDKEIYTRGQQTREQLLSANLGGMTHDWFSSTGKYATLYKDEIPGFGWNVILPPANINGEVAEASSRSVLHAMGWGISKDCKKIEAAIKYMDFWMSEEGRTLNAYGVEGVHYDVVNGEKVFKKEVLNAKEGVPTYMRNQGQVEIGTVGSIAAELAGMSGIAKEGYLKYEAGNFVKKQFITPNFTEEETEKKDDKWNDISTYVSEMEQKWILGVSDVDKDWDTYINTINKMGMADVTKIYNDAYKRQQKILKK